MTPLLDLEALAQQEAGCFFVVPGPNWVS